MGRLECLNISSCRKLEISRTITAVSINLSLLRLMGSYILRHFTTNRDAQLEMATIFVVSKGKCLLVCSDLLGMKMCQEVKIINYCHLILSFMSDLSIYFQPYIEIFPSRTIFMFRLISSSGNTEHYPYKIQARFCRFLIF